MVYATAVSVPSTSSPRLPRSFRRKRAVVDEKIINRVNLSHTGEIESIRTDPVARVHFVDMAPHQRIA
ncbi:hypothetical protein LNP25_21830 [Klebsiella variicola subsp. variicola]|nr:hypothetical protein [Klebsiella variicola subsp. variicola]